MEPQDDLGQDYLNAPEESVGNVLDAARRRQQETQRRAEHLSSAADVETEINTGWFTASQEEDDGILDNTFEVLGSGLERAVEGLVNLPGDIARSLAPPPDPETAALVNIIFPRTDLPDVDRPDSVAGEFASSAVQFLLPFSAALKVARIPAIAGPVERGAVVGAFTDFTVFDPHAARLSDLLTTWGKGNPAFDNAVTQYLASDITDSALDGRVKNALEGLAAGGVVDGLVSSVKWLKSYRGAKALREAGEVRDATPVPKQEIEQEPRPQIEEDPNTSAAAHEADHPEHTLAEDIRAGMTIKPEEAVKISAKILDGEFGAASELVSFNADRIAWDKLDEGDAVQQLLAGFEDAIEPLLDATGHLGVKSHKSVQLVGHLVGYTADNAHKLAESLKRGGGLDSKMFAAHQAMVASAGHMNKLAQVAKKTQAPADMLALHRHVEAHAALMAQVKGSQKEIARALSAMRIMKDASADSFREFENVKRHMGGHKDTDRLIDEILNAEKLEQVNVITTRTAGRKAFDILTEIVINGLLSSVKTHVINLSSNAVQTVVSPMDRYIAAGIGRLSNAADRVTLREANAELVGKISSTTQAFRLAARALKEGKPITDLRQRIEFDARKQIHMDTTGLSGGKLSLARTINFLGDFIRLPGRALLAGDEFFKTVNRNGEIHAQAYRAANKAADGRKFKNSAARQKWVKAEQAKLIKEPTVAIQAKALEMSRRNTFQESPETFFGPKVEGLLNSHPLIKLVVAPFVRTPMNLLRQSFVDRNPVLFAVVQKNRDILAKGGPEAHIVMARTVVGAGAAMTAYGLVDAGIITGKGADFSNTEKLAEKEYAITIAGREFVYNRLDPLGSIVGLVADTHYAFTHGYDPQDPDSNSALMELSQAVMLAFMQNALNKTWAQSLHDLMETADIAASGSNAYAQRKMDQFVANQVTKGIPYSSFLRSTTQSTDEVVREAWTIRDRVFRNLPGLSDDLPPVRDYLGREVTRENAMWFWINPFGANPESDNPVDVELARLEIDYQPLPKSIDQSAVQLNSAQYSELKRLIGFGIEDYSLEQQYHDLITSPQWATYPDPLRVKIVKDIFSARKSLAQALLFANDSTLRRDTILHDLREVEGLTGQDLSAQKQRIKEMFQQPQ